MPYGEARAWALRASGGRAGRQRGEHLQRPWGANRSGVLGAVAAWSPGEGGRWLRPRSWTPVQFRGQLATC